MRTAIRLFLPADDGRFSRSTPFTHHIEDSSARFASFGRYVLWACRQANHPWPQVVSKTGLCFVIVFLSFFDCQSTDLEPHRSTSLLVVCAGNSRTSHGVQDAVLTLVKPLRQAFFLMKHKSPYPCQSQENPILLDAMRRSAADDLLWNLPGMLQQRRGWG